MRCSHSCLKVGEAQEERAQCKKKKSHIMNYQELEKEKEKKYMKFFLLLVKS